MEPIKLMVARFPFGRRDEPDVTDWLIRTVIEARDDARIKEILPFRVNDTPITMSRNLTIKAAIQEKVDFVLWVDNDMAPDHYLPTNPNRALADSNAVPFWGSSFEFLWKQRQQGTPGVIAAPYCGPPPHENVYVFRWETFESDRPGDQPNSSLEAFSRSESFDKRGIEEVGALPTGLMLFDMRCLEGAEPPYTYYEWEDDTQSEKASTEDVTFTRDISLRGHKVWCNWDTWCGHWKSKCVGRPMILTAAAVSDQFRRSVLSEHGIGRNEELRDVGGNGNGDHRESRAVRSDPGANGSEERQGETRRPLGSNH